MLCCNCPEYKALLAIEEHIVRTLPNEKIITEIFNQFSEITQVSLNCENCGLEIMVGESYFSYKDDNKDFVIKKIVEYVAGKINSEIQGCHQCSHPADVFSGMRSAYNEEDDNVEEMIESLDTSIEVFKTPCLINAP